MSTCRFCNQWNPPKEPRCAFCQNLLAGADDQTTLGRSQMSAQQIAAIPAAQKSMFETGSAGFTSQLTPRQWRFIGGLVFFLISLLLGGAWHCR